MRTTVDLPDDLHQQALSIARDTSRTLSETIADLMRRGLNQRPAGQITVSPATGWPVISVGRVITTEDVRSLDDDE
ncbi:antitoxin VapB29 [Pseudonocardia eucalypti]|uniref:Antitoxin VapB29 n=1 Tax=Pseudonocardia eucalypti TaxID=648755 RepID=A0ABP9PUC8_9PSEU|nr:putative transcriptional regulator [Pseudonocardia eucalypti]